MNISEFHFYWYSNKFWNGFYFLHNGPPFSWCAYIPYQGMNKYIQSPGVLRAKNHFSKEVWKISHSVERRVTSQDFFEVENDRKTINIASLP